MGSGKGERQHESDSGFGRRRRGGDGCVFVDGERGRFVYRGHWVRDLAVSRRFEEVVHLLWYGHLPSMEEERRFGRPR